MKNSIIADNALFSFLYGGRPFGEYAPEVRADGGSTEFLFPDGLKVTCVYKEYGEFGACEWVNYFENTGDKPSQVISELYDCDIGLPFAHDGERRNTAYQPDPDMDMKIYSPVGSVWSADEFHCNIDECRGNDFINHIYPGQVKSYACSGGRSSDGKAPFFNIYRQGEGVICAVGWTGQWNCRISRSAESVGIRSKIEDTNFRLLPGEKFRTSSFVMMRYNGDMTDGQNKWRRFVKSAFSVIGEGRRAENAPFCAGVWGGMTTDGVLERIDIIRKNVLPFEYIWMDAGWYGDSEQESPDEFEGDWWQHAGDWRVNKTHHPDGLAEVAAAVKAAGMKFLLWFEPERAISGTPITVSHPEYFIPSPDSGERSMLLDLGNEAAWQYCFETLSDIIERLGVDCYRQDFNFCPLAFWRSADSAERKGITEIKHINGLYRLWDSLLRRFPGLIIDNCASGGRRIDIETLRRSVPLWRSDYQCPANFTVDVSQSHGISFGAWMPYSGTGAGRKCDPYLVRSSYAAGMTTNYTFSERDSFGSPEQLEWIKKYAAEYLRTRPFFSCDMYPLTEAVTGEGAWCAVQYDRPEHGDGIVQVFKHAKSPYERAVFPLRGLDPNGEYVFEDADGGFAEFGGAELAERGFPVEMIERRVAKLWFYRKK